MMANNLGAVDRANMRLFAGCGPNYDGREYSHVRVALQTARFRNGALPKLKSGRTSP